MKIARLATDCIRVLALVAISTSAATTIVQPLRPQSTPDESAERAIQQVVRELQMDLEASSSAGFLRKIDQSKFEDFRRFQDQVERLARENNVRVYFRQVTLSVQERSARTVLDAEMEMSRRDAAIPPQRRRQQITLDLEQGGRGWQIVHITPREFFRPL